MEMIMVTINMVISNIKIQYNINFSPPPTPPPPPQHHHYPMLLPQ